MADSDPGMRLGHYTERAEDYVARGVFDTTAEVFAAALDALDHEEAKVAAILREKLEEALADPRPMVPMDEAFKRLDEAKARRRA